MQKIAQYNGSFMDLVQLEEKLAAVNGLQVWECSCGSKFMTVYGAAYHCEKHHLGEGFKDKMRLRDDFVTDTKQWNQLYSAVSDIVVKTMTPAITDPKDLNPDEPLASDNSSAVVVKSEDIEDQTRPAESSSDMSIDTESTKSSPASPTDSFTDAVMGKTKIFTDIGTNTEPTKDIKEDEERVSKRPTVTNNCTQTDFESEGSTEFSGNWSDTSWRENYQPEVPQASTQPLTTASNYSQGNMSRPFMQQREEFSPQRTLSLPTSVPFNNLPAMIMRPWLPYPIPDPGLFPYPPFGLLYEERQLFWPDGTQTVFNWQKHVEYYAEMMQRNLDPITARRMWMKYYVPINMPNNF